MQTDKRAARFHACREIGAGTYLFTLRVEDDHALDYQAGHVFALDLIDEQGKTLHHPYTIVDNDAQQRLLSFVFRLIPDGNMTPRLVNANAHTQLAFSGKFHAPIIDEIDVDAQCFIGISTGSGIGPLYGFLKDELENISIPVHLLAAYRYEAERCFVSELDALAEEHEHFQWQACISQASPSWQGLRGRVDQQLTKIYPSLTDTHFHLVGNGSMINLIRPALLAAGTPEVQVSKESFFKHGEKVEQEAIDALAQKIVAVNACDNL